MRTCVLQVHVNTRTDICIYIYIYICLYLDVHTYMHTRMRGRNASAMVMYVHLYTCIRMYICARRLVVLVCIVTLLVFVGPFRSLYGFRKKLHRFLQAWDNLISALLTSMGSYDPHFLAAN